MTKFQKRTLNAFIIGFVGFVLTIIIAFLGVDIFWVKLIGTPSTIILCLTTIISAINPIDD